ncbi:MAG: type IV secretion system DNA-binding domain-containing protein [Candidatus Kaiserbacteria bacterium]|nr:type IV secretion system DNA-binding domain-containing protein [Candidatus Kaiserbacteria bacterium]
MILDPLLDKLTDLWNTLLASERVTQAYALFGAAIGIWVMSMAALWFTKRRSRKKALKEAVAYTLLQVTQTPHAGNDEQQNDLVQIRLFEDLLHSIVPEKKSITLEMAVPSKGTDIMFFIAVPKEYEDTVKTQVRRVFERAQVQEVSDYTIFREGGHSELLDLTLSQYDGLPIYTYKKSETDTFAPIIGTFASAREDGVGIAMQLTLRRSDKQKAREIRGVLKDLRRGKRLKEIKPTGVGGKLQQAAAVANTGDEKEPEASPEAALVEEKVSEQLYNVTVRLGICTDSEEKTRLLSETLQGRFESFGSAEHNAFSFTKRKDKTTALNFTFRLHDVKRSSTLNAQEITSIFHLPTRPLEVGNLQWMKTKRVAAPTETATEGLFLGDNLFHDQKKEIYMPEQDRLRHIYIIGQTGTGKTASIKSMAYQDIQSGKGLCIIDPHGDLVDDMLTTIPESRLDDVIVFDPSNVKSPLGLNMLEYDKSRPEEKTFIVNEILSIFNRLFGQNNPESTGPAFQQYMRNTLLLLMDGKQDEPATLMEVPRVFTDDSFRESLLKQCTLEPVRQFWEDEASKVEGDWSLSNIAPYITSKFGNFTTNDYVRPIIEQPHSSFSFREVMDSGKMLFVKLPKGKIGEINAQLLGMLVTGKIALAAFSRDDVPEHERKDFFFYIDEFQNFTTDSISQILSEARKYHLSLTIAHQYMEQLTDDIRGAVLGNVGTTIAFRTGIQDAEILEKKFSPEFSAQELSDIENLNCVISMLSNQKVLSPFTMHIRFAPQGNPNLRDHVISYTSLKHQKEVQKKMGAHN